MLGNIVPFTKFIFESIKTINNNLVFRILKLYGWLSGANSVNIGKRHFRGLRLNLVK